jgi:acetyl esterase/lipase
MSWRDLLDPEVGALLGGFDIEMSAETLPAMRFVLAADPVPDVTRTERIVPGESPLPARIHRPASATEPLPCIYSIHGGGYVMGTYDMDDALFNALCPALGVVGVTVDYRLAPETPYPGPLEDCYRGLAWTYEHAEELGIDPARIGLHGLSAGGGLAAALALLARDRGEVPLAFAVLDSPMLDDRQVTASASRDDIPVWTKAANEFGWRAYLGELYGTDQIPATAAPGRAEDLRGLPPTFVGVGALDGFRDEAVDFALRLTDAGVPAELHVYPGACHGFSAVVDAAVSRQAARDRDEWLARATRPR